MNYGICRVVSSSRSFGCVAPNLRLSNIRELVNGHVVREFLKQAFDVSSPRE